MVVVVVVVVGVVMMVVVVVVIQSTLCILKLGFYPTDLMDVINNVNKVVNLSF